ncbi:hypothetical protein AV521_38475 [Streptomyces sp. IMTB 2501]|uniref:hypothetical protein n=1 Tax=Streptomyces sp. IMTB 2501 TaxID=1776340 RepID=UPI00096E1FB9|nr:hypothetical protein [Streptomyces sp. IMTB 2501]OLZ63674.1 hypothetical protein AV521_38475 [Streptomyces sp. IMTB 2501]
MPGRTSAPHERQNTKYVRGVAAAVVAVAALITAANAGPAHAAPAPAAAHITSADPTPHR